jgi:hypothetical protein
VFFPADFGPLHGDSPGFCAKEIGTTAVASFRASRIFDEVFHRELENGVIRFFFFKEYGGV